MRSLSLLVVFSEAPNGLRYWRWGGLGRGREQEKLEARKMFVNAAESPASSARFVGTLYAWMNGMITATAIIASTNIVICQFSFLDISYCLIRVPSLFFIAVR